MNGYTGKILLVDLTSREWHEETVPDEVYQRCLSGLGLAAHILNERIPSGDDPLGPQNILGFVTGILSGTGAMFSGRWLAVGKSPLTGGWGDASCGGNLAGGIKHSGYDGVFITGASQTPVYIYADGRTVEIHDASELWGKDAVETEAELVQRHGKKACVGCIGPAGEALALISGIVNDHGRLAARSGLGAVMGSKKLKALVMAGSHPVKTAKPVEFHEIIKKVAATVPKKAINLPGWALPLLVKLVNLATGDKKVSRLDGMMAVGLMRKWGTAMNNELSVMSGDGPVRNWRGTPRLYHTSHVNPDQLNRAKKKTYSCYSCPLGCGAIVELKGEYLETHRPEYETTAALGALLLLQDLDTIEYINEYLNRAGIDSISAGSVIAFAMDCFEHGLLTEQDTGGLQLRWGDPQAIKRLVQMIVNREGVGDMLADGVKRASQQIGRGSEQYAFHAGGQELPMHDPRKDPGYGVHYAGDPTPGRHTMGCYAMYDLLRLWTRVSWAPEPPHSYPDADRYQASTENGVKMAACGMVKMVLDGAGLCLFGAQMGVDRLAVFELLNAATGWSLRPDEYMEIGRHVESLRQVFNIRQGLEPASVQMNPRVHGASPASAGPLKGKHYALYAMRREYWKAMKWDPQTGHPLEVEEVVLK
ncbi:MAG: aldehyde ferredoxin oxidoreductase family protein [Omnitrophica WOR_2 bacterium]